MKKLQEEQGKEQQNTERKGEKVEYVSRTVRIESMDVPDKIVLNLPATRYIDIVTCGHRQPIFHPPSAW